MQKMSAFLSIVFTLFLQASCKKNIFERYEKVDPLKASARELDKGNVDKAFALFLEALPEHLRHKLSNGNLNLTVVTEIDKAVETYANRKQIMGLLSVLISRKSGINLISLGDKLSKSKSALEPEKLITEIMSSLSSEANVASQIEAAITASKLSGASSSSDKLNEAILHTASIAAKLKEIDQDGNNSVSADELTNLTIADSEQIHKAFQEAYIKASEAAAQSNDQNLEKVKTKLEQVSTQIANTEGNTIGEKTKNFIENLLSIIEASSTPTPATTTATSQSSEDVIIKELAITVIDGKRVVRSMVVFGDSLAVGIGSDFKRNSTIDLATFSAHPGVASLLSKMNFPGYTNYQGDVDQATIVSYDSAYSATRKTIDACKQNFDPNLCFSHAARLKVPYLKSYAVSGSKIKDVVETQLPKLIQSDAHIDYAVINIGGNDFCSMGFDLATFSDNYRKLLQALYDYKSKPIIMISGIPNVVGLFKNISDSTEAFHLISEVTGKFDVSCGDIRWQFCPRAANFKDSLDTQLAIIESMTSSIRSIVDSMDPKKERLFFAESFKNMQISEDIVGIDCFHANVDGYRGIADLTFSTVQSALLPSD